MGTKRDIAKRMSDMTGYTGKERIFTILASIAPYPFMIATVWTPFTKMAPLLCLGILLYTFGIVSFVATLKVIVETRSEDLFRNGPFRFTRNPLYVSATIVFLGICLVTSNILLIAYLAIATFLQHMMILAEERICKDKYGIAYLDYLKRVPRYLAIQDSTQPSADGDALRASSRNRGTHFERSPDRSCSSSLRFAIRSAGERRDLK